MTRATVLVEQTALQWRARPEPMTAAEWLTRRADDYRATAEYVRKRGDTDDGLYLAALADDLRECAAALLADVT